jgi:hypothetical protein
MMKRSGSGPLTNGSGRPKNQGCGSGFNRVCGSGSRRAKMTTKVEKNLLKFMFWSVGWPVLRAEGFFYNLDILLVIKALDPDPDWSPASNSGSGSGKNEYGSTTLPKTYTDTADPEHCRLPAQEWVQYVHQFYFGWGEIFHELHQRGYGVASALLVRSSVVGLDG